MTDETRLLHRSSAVLPAVYESGWSRKVAEQSNAVDAFGQEQYRNMEVSLSNTPQLGAPPRRVSVDVRMVANGGWDNWTFHLGSEMSVRLPSAAEYTLAVEKEHRWLPELAPRLPLPISTPLAKGDPGAGYPFAWSVYKRLEGEPASAGRIADLVRFAVDLAGFLAASQSVDTAGGPSPGKHNWFRGGTLRTYDETAQKALVVGGPRRRRPGRHALGERLSVSEATWARGRGWALWKTLAACAHDVSKADEESANAWRVLGEIFAEYEAGGRSTVRVATGA
jgi:aminoglycoside phosphotransferase (APT) family kinase protein